jgi:hypothetical protein
MKRLQKEIEASKASIEQKKQQLELNYAIAKMKLTSTSNLALAAVAGLGIGFLLLPKRKYKLIKSVLKAYSVATTLKGFLDLVPGQPLNQKK